MSQRRCAFTRTGIPASGPASLLLGTACHYLDPQCLTADQGRKGRRAHGVVLQLRLQLPLKRHTKGLDLVVNGAGGVTYFEFSGESVTTCRRMSEEEQEDVARLWAGETLGMSMPRCGPGYAFHHRRDIRACDESWSGLAERSRGHRLPYASLLHGRPVEEGVSFAWDMESPLPEDLDRAFVGTLGLLCGESQRLARNLRRSLPEFAARAGCVASAAGPAGQNDG